ncbi:MAG: hypothetical protein U0359_00700 [Byssovorax sp.]
MAQVNIDRAELEKALGLHIPESAVVEVTITAKDHPHPGKMLKGGGDAGAPTFAGRITFEGGKAIDVRAVNTTPFNIDWFKKGMVAPCW